MKKAMLWLLALSALGGGGYWGWQKHTGQRAGRTSGAAAVAATPAPSPTAVVAARNLHFAITAARLSPIQALRYE